ncbi:hypothetical protein PAPYR_7393 [Paratrimastix pyriformis]|uniref:Uncharacterized protein n=1 Tax=Paratrimastix pyriformis TaxID=342808 RepID=A0ABQ8UFS6_9EUKA|nr:hypothetical protein PAPYR_7393 [Paratrimastix pyriformis]
MIWHYRSWRTARPVTLRLSPECKPQQAVLYHLGRDPLILVGLSELRGHGLVLGDTPTITPLNIPVDDDDNDLGDDDYGGEAIVGRLVLAGPLGALDSDGQPDLAALALAAPRIATLATPPSGVSESSPVWIAPASEQPHLGKAAPTLPVVRRDVLTDPEAQQVTDLLGEDVERSDGWSITKSKAMPAQFRETNQDQRVTTQMVQDGLLRLTFGAQPQSNGTETLYRSTTAISEQYRTNRAVLHDR